MSVLCIFLLLLLLSLVSTGALQYLIMMKRYNNNNNHLPHVCRCAFIFGDYHLPIKREKKSKEKRESLLSEPLL